MHFLYTRVMYALPRLEANSSRPEEAVIGLELEPAIPRWFKFLFFGVDDLSIPEHILRSEVNEQEFERIPQLLWLLL